MSPIKFGDILTAKNTFVVAINVVVLIVLLAAVVFVPPVIVDSVRIAKSHVAPPVDPRSTLPNYASQIWPRKHFAEFMSLHSKYYDYIEWRREAFAGETIHIDERGHRRHSWKPGSDFPSAQVWLFGGSTMWGYGSRDFETIPADVERISGLHTFNFAEAGYVAHQSLNLLQQAYLEGGNPKFVFFYDGVNEAGEKCMSGQSVYGTTYETAIRSFVGLHSRQEAHSLVGQVFYPTIEALRIITQRLVGGPQTTGSGPANSTFYDCQRNPQKVHAIAAALIADWAAAKALVESHGGRFLPILQPVGYVGSPNLTHLKSIIPYMGEHTKSVTEDVVLRKQYELVYAEIKKLLAERHIEYLDMTHAFDGDKLYFIDECHVSPNGNEVIAKRIVSALR